MSTIYTQHPAGYPKKTYSVTGARRRYWIMSDWWDTATSHEGEARERGPYSSRSSAEADCEKLQSGLREIEPGEWR